MVRDDENMKETIRKDVENYIEKGFLLNQTFGDALYEICRKKGTDIALIDEKKRMSYMELLRESNRIAALMYEQGLRKGDNVLLHMPNSVEYVTVLFALLTLGARPALMLPDHSETELLAIGRVLEPKAIITVKEEMGVEYGQQAKRVTEELKSVEKIFLDKEADYAVSIYQKSTLAMLPFSAEKPQPYDIALFLLSGGTTGIPKIIPRLHAAYITNAVLSAKRCCVTEESIYLAVLSTSHDYPLCAPGIFGTLFAGGKCILAKTASPEEAFEWIRKEKATFTQIVPVIAGLWVEAATQEKDTSSLKLKHIEVGAAKLEWEIAEKLENTFSCKIFQGYGLGEGITCFTAIDDSDEITRRTQGKPISQADRIRIVDANGNDVKQGEAGELWETGPYTFYGYYKSPERNEGLFSEDGYLKTGDKAMLTPEGNIVILGRVREQINRAGENIIPEEIESFIRQWEYVKEVAVIGIPDEQLGEAVCAVVIGEGEEKKLENLCEFLATLKIARYKYPDRLIYVDKIPYVNVGKVDKKKLKKMILGEEK